MNEFNVFAIQIQTNTFRFNVTLCVNFVLNKWNNTRLEFLKVIV